MQQWQKSESRPGYKSKTLQYGACTIVVHRPELSQKERAKVEQSVQETLGREMHKIISRQRAAAQSA